MPRPHWPCSLLRPWLGVFPVHAMDRDPSFKCPAPPWHARCMHTYASARHQPYLQPLPCSFPLCVPPAGRDWEDGGRGSFSKTRACAGAVHATGHSHVLATRCHWHAASPAAFLVCVRSPCDRHATFSSRGCRCGPPCTAPACPGDYGAPKLTCRGGELDGGGPLEEVPRRSCGEGQVLGGCGCSPLHRSAHRHNWTGGCKRCQEPSAQASLGSSPRDWAIGSASRGGLNDNNTQSSCSSM